MQAAWSRFLEQLEIHHPKTRWRLARGLIGSVIATLLDMVWQPLSSTQWKDPEDSLWVLADSPVDAAALKEEMMRTCRVQQWKQAARHYNGSGLEEGADTTILKA
eukprot:5636488-Karenia_brevis.AAC.1